MKNNFTTPAFAKVLKEHGIDYKSPFKHYHDYETPNVKRIGIDCVYGMVDIKTHEVTEGQNVCKDLPAYPLTEVLGWLPKTIIEHVKPTNILSHRPDYLSYPITSDIDDNNVLKIGYKSEYFGTKITPMPIETLITKGLTEGWLTKDNLNLNNHEHPTSNAR
jgi:hypothetical protein